MQELKDKIIETGKLLWDKGLATGFNGNISARAADGTFMITATGTSLGYLTAPDIVLVDDTGKVVGDGKASSEKAMHADIYKNFPQIHAVVHTHPTYTNGYFLGNDSFTPKSFEARFYLGEVKSIEQTTPSVTDTEPVIKELRTNNILVLRNHGAIAIGPDLFRAFVLLQELEEQVKVDFVSAHYQQTPTRGHVQQEQRNVSPSPSTQTKKYKLFSKEQIEEIVRLVNNDAQMKELGAKTAMNMDLAVCLKETGDVYSFTFENGRIARTGKDAQAEFLITASEAVWRAVFNREIDPFVATTQKKMDLKGDFARISKWYAPCSRIFQLWTKVPVE